MAHTKQADDDLTASASVAMLDAKRSGRTGLEYVGTTDRLHWTSRSPEIVRASDVDRSATGLAIYAFGDSDRAAPIGPAEFR